MLNVKTLQLSVPPFVAPTTKITPPSFCLYHSSLALSLSQTLSLHATPSSSFHPSCLFLPLTANLNLSLYLYKACFLGSVWAVCACVCRGDKSEVFTHTHTSERSLYLEPVSRALIKPLFYLLRILNCRSLGRNRTINFTFPLWVARLHSEFKCKKKKGGAVIPLRWFTWFGVVLTTSTCSSNFFPTIDRKINTAAIWELECVIIWKKWDICCFKRKEKYKKDCWHEKLSTSWVITEIMSHFKDPPILKTVMFFRI